MRGLFFDFIDLAFALRKLFASSFDDILAFGKLQFLSAKLFFFGSSLGGKLLAFFDHFRSRIEFGFFDDGLGLFLGRLDASVQFLFKCFCACFDDDLLNDNSQHTAGN